MTDDGANGQARKFGTFGGVFTPSILTILSAILFMRANFVVGEAGVTGAVIILLVANAIAVLSALSVCAVSTNLQVRGGGAYFLISRVLGPEFGGAIGIVFFIALSLNVAFNVLGFTEALVGTVPSLAPYQLLITLIAAGLLFGIAFIGAEWSIKTQFVIMFILVFSLAAMWGGMLMHFNPEVFSANLGPGYSPLAAAATGNETKYNFWMVFAIFFPAVTGFLAGVNMSGDLRDPQRSIPAGTFLAVGVGAAAYLLTMLLGAGAFERIDLINRPYEVIAEHALFGLGFMVAAGVFAATLSTALGSYLGAPRVLQAVARDRLMPLLGPFAKGSRNGDEPRRALVLTGVLTFAVLIWAGLAGGGNAFNTVASIISMVFLATYGMINLAAFIEGFGNNPSFRPRFRAFHWVTALLGFLGCLGAALLIDPWPALAAAAVVGGLYWYLRRRDLRVNFGDARRGYVFQQARNYLLQLKDMPEDSRNWRPTILAFCGNPSKHEKLVTYAVWLEAGRGIVQFVNIIRGQVEDDKLYHLRAARHMEELLEEKGMLAFPVAAVTEDVATGIQLILQTAATGPIRPNVALFGWNSAPETAHDYVEYLRSARDCAMSTVLVSRDEEMLFTGRKRIDIWWRGRKNGALMLLLAHLMHRNWEWAKARIRLVRMIDDEAGREPAREALTELINQARVDVEAEVIVSEDGFSEVLHRHSRDADCVFLGFEVPDDADEAAWHARYNALVEDMPTLVLVRSAVEDDLLA